MYQFEKRETGQVRICTEQKEKHQTEKEKHRQNKVTKKQETFTNTPRTSRRKRQRYLRRQQKELTKDSTEEHQLYNQRKREIVEKINRQIIDEFGFVANPSHTLRHNLAYALTQVPLSLFLSQPLNPSFHNLCIQTQPPDNAASLLNLGLNFCLRQPFTTDTIKLNIALKRFRRDFYTKVFYAGSIDTFNPKQLFIRSDWEPDTALIPTEIIVRYQQFAKGMKRLLV